MPELCDAVHNGTVLELPCKVGDTVYHKNHEIIIKSIEIRNHGIYFYGLSEENETYRFAIIDNGRNDFGKTVFLTKQEARKVLEAQKPTIKIEVQNGRYCGDCPCQYVRERYVMSCAVFKTDLQYHAMIDRYEKCEKCLKSYKEGLNE